jgi:hypothetical protein
MRTGKKLLKNIIIIPEKIIQSFQIKNCIKNTNGKFRGRIIGSLWSRKGKEALFSTRRNVKK